MGKILNPLLVSFSLILLFAISTSFVSNIYAEIFEFNPEDYYESDKNPSEGYSTNDGEIHNNKNHLIQRTEIKRLV